MEVVVTVPPLPPPSSMDFNFDSNCSSPYITAPSSPQRFANNFFFSAPTSPTRHSSASASYVPNTTSIEVDIEDEFQFDFNTHLQRPSLSAEELFFGGKIRPLKPLSPSTTIKNKILSSSKKEKMVIEDLLPSPSSLLSSHNRDNKRVTSFLIPSVGGKSERIDDASQQSRSDRLPECDKDISSSQAGKNNGKIVETVSTTYSSFLSSISFTKGYRKWRIKDFLLFRSASEGRATDKDPLRKYAVLSKTTAHEDVRNVSFRSVESSGSGSESRRRGAVSAHELHYKVNRAASVELKKKTLLPYKQGLLGCLGFNHGMHHFTARIGSSGRS